MCLVSFSAINEIMPDGTMQSFPEGAITLVYTFSSGGPVLNTTLVCPQVTLQSPMHAPSQPCITTSLTTTQFNSGTACVVSNYGDYLHFSNDSDVWMFPITC